MQNQATRDFWSAKNQVLSEEKYPNHSGMEDTWVIVYHDFFENFPNETDLKLEKTAEFLESIRAAGELLASFEFLPIAIAKLDKSQVESLRANPVFRFAFMQQGEPKPYSTILKALSALRNQSIYQFSMWGEHVESGKSLPSEEFEGGLWPESPYPEFEGESKIHLRCAPAIMPVLNLSIGPGSNIAYSVNPVTVALEFISNSHLITVASGNSSAAPVNEFAAMSALCVGASEDRAGHRFAQYSSFGGANTGIHDRGNDLVAYGGPPENSGTSYAAPRVALFGCFCQAILLQIERLFRWKYHSKIAGVPLVGVGTLDVLDGSIGLQSRIAEHATPFVTFNPELEGAVTALHAIDARWDARINGRQLKSMLCSMAAPRIGSERGMWGSGFIDEDIVLKGFAATTIQEILALLLRNEDLLKIDARLLNAKFISRNELEQLWAFVARAAPIWTYDVERVTFQVNRVIGDGERVHMLPAHGHKVVSAFQEVGLEKYRRLRADWQTYST